MERTQPHRCFCSSNGNFRGTTLAGAANGFGSVLEITPAGKLTTLYSFCSVSGCIDGISPETALIQGTDGNFYGTPDQGGTTRAGTVFKLTRRCEYHGCAVSSSRYY
jgi:uncharacterized repeat protein (TIGR03803 family)